MSERELSDRPDDAPADDGNKGFADAFAERSAGADTDNRPDSPPSGSDKEGADAPSEEQTGKDGQDDNSPDQKPAEDPKEEKQFDPFTGMSPEQRAYWSKVEQSERSQKGRVSSLTRKLNGQSAQQPASQEQQQQNADEAKKLAEDLEKVAEEYPDVGGPLKAALDQIKAKVDGLAEKVTPLAEQADTAVLNEAYAMLEEKHPDFVDIASSDRFKEWAGSQSPGIQNLAKSFDPEEVSLVLTLYKTEAGIQPPARQQQDTGKSETDAKRDRQLDANRDAPQRGAPAASGTPNDFSAAFQARARKFAIQP